MKARTARRLAALAMMFGVFGTTERAEAQDWIRNLYRVDTWTTEDFVGSEADPNDTFRCGPCSGLQTGWVQAALTNTADGPRPTLSGVGAAYAGANQIAGAAGTVLAWWTPGAFGGGVTLESSQNVTIANNSFDSGPGWFPSGESNNSRYQRSAWFTAFASNGGTANWSLGGDDDAWLFINGQLALDNGGVKSFSAITQQSVSWNAGDRIDIFFADRHVVESRLTFNLTGLTTSTVPEPGTYALLATGLVGLSLAGWRRRRQQQ